MTVTVRRVTVTVTGHVKPIDNLKCFYFTTTSSQHVTTPYCFRKMSRAGDLHIMCQCERNLPLLILICLRPQLSGVYSNLLSYMPTFFLEKGLFLYICAIYLLLLRTEEHVAEFIGEIYWLNCCVTYCVTVMRDPSQGHGHVYLYPVPRVATQAIANS